jgi:hypothetical protein
MNLTAFPLAVCLLTITAAAQSPAADTKPQRFFRLDFVTEELDGSKIVDRHQFSTSCSTNAEIRANSSVSVPVGPSNANVVNYDLGAAFTIHQLHETVAGISASIIANLSTLDADAEFKERPVVRRQTWSGDINLALRKPTVIFSSDNLTNKRKTQVLLTVTPTP